MRSTKIIKIWSNIGPPSTTLNQHWSNIVLTSWVCWHGGSLRNKNQYFTRPNKHETYKQYRFDVGPSSSATLAQHYSSMVSCLLGTERIRSYLKNWILPSHSRIIFKNKFSYCHSVYKYTMQTLSAVDFKCENYTIIIQIFTLAHCSSRPILAALPKRTSNSCSVARGYHCFINAATFRDVSLFEGSIQILGKRTNLTVSILRQICIISEMEISHYLVKFIASHKIRDQRVLHFSWICPVEQTLWQATEVLYLIC